MLQAGELLMNRYEIIRMVGQGGMSTVYQAKDRTTKKLLAIKDIRRSGKDKDQTVEQSLVAEGRMLMQLSNPRLPKIYEIIETDDTIMLVMDFIQGESLDKVLDRKGPQSVQKTLDWGMQICEVFHYLHNQPTPIIYRDMKPANIMLQPNGQLMMIDFGTARTQKVGVAMQADTICIGTQGFAAPEQYGGLGQSDARTDIFCLGSTLYNIVTGHNPSVPPVGIQPLGMYNPALNNSPLAEIITKCTRNDPNERYQTAMELYEDLRQASLGTYKQGIRGKTMSFGTIRKNTGFRKQDNQGNGVLTSGLSGLLQRGLDATQQIQETLTTQQQTNTVSTQVQSNSGWQQASYQVAAQDYTQYQTQEQTQNSGIPKPVLIGLAITLVLLLLAVVLAIVKSYTAAVAVMIFSLAAAVITLVFLIQSRNGNL